LGDSVTATRPIPSRFEVTRNGEEGEMYWSVFVISALAIAYIWFSSYYVSGFSAYMQSSNTNMLEYPDWITRLPLLLGWVLLVICLPGALIGAIISCLVETVRSRWRWRGETS